MTAIKFGTDGWRGVIAEDFTYANVRIVAHAIARYVVRGEDARKGVLIGYDHRFASDTFAAAVAEVISATGTPVWLADKPCPTPAISLLVRQRKAAGGIDDHRQPQSLSLERHQVQSQLRQQRAALHRRANRNRTRRRSSNPASRRCHRGQTDSDRSTRALPISTPSRNSSIGIACATRSSASSPTRCTAPQPDFFADIFARNGIACDEIRGTRDPLFGGVHPEPIEPHIDPLRKAVLAGKYDAGFCADGDGDRIGAIDRDGSFVNPHQIFALLVWHLAGTRNLAGDIAKTFSVTKLIDKLAAKFGRKLHEVPIGFKYICELMLEQNILIGGEESGGIGTSLYLPERDATVSALLLAELMAWHGKSLGELLAALHKEFGEYHYGRVDLDVKPGQKEKAIDLFFRHETQASSGLAHHPARRHGRHQNLSRRDRLGDGARVRHGKSASRLLRNEQTRNDQTGSRRRH